MGVIVFSCSPTAEPTEIQWTVSNPWSHRWSWWTRRQYKRQGWPWKKKELTEMGDGSNLSISYMCMKIPKNKFNFQKDTKVRYHKKKFLKWDKLSMSVVWCEWEMPLSGSHIWTHFFYLMAVFERIMTGGTYRKQSLLWGGGLLEASLPGCKGSVTRKLFFPVRRPPVTWQTVSSGSITRINPPTLKLHLLRYLSQAKWLRHQRN